MDRYQNPCEYSQGPRIFRTRQDRATRLPEINGSHCQKQPKDRVSQPEQDHASDLDNDVIRPCIRYRCGYHHRNGSSGKFSDRSRVSHVRSYFSPSDCLFSELHLFEALAYWGLRRFSSCDGLPRPKALNLFNDTNHWTVHWRV